MQTLQRKQIGVIDGQGGGIGRTIIRKIREELDESVEIVALGTNAIATAAMLKAKANRGASGEDAVCFCVSRLDVIIGSIAISWPHAMMGELTPRIATAITSSSAHKLYIPVSQENATVVATELLPLPILIDKLIEYHLLPLIQGDE